MDAGRPGDQPGARVRSSPRSPAAALGGTEAFRRQLEHAARRLDDDARLRADARLERPPRRVGRRRRRRRPRGSLRRAAGRPAQPAVPRPRRRHLRGRRPIAPASASSTTPRSRCSPTSTTTATRIWCWPPARSRCCSSTTARAASRRSPTRSRFDAPLQGVLTGLSMADYDRDGFLDVYLCVYSYFFGAGEDKAGTPMPYHDARNGPPGVLFRNDGTGRFVDATKAQRARRRQRSLPLRGGVGRLRRGRLARPARRQRLRRQEPVSQPRRARRRGPLRGRRGAGRRARPRRRHERGVPRLRQRRPPRHLHRQHVDRATASASPRRRRSCPTRPADVRALYRQHARGNSLYPQPRRRPLRGHVARRPRANDGPLGVVVRHARLRQRRLGRSLRRQRHADARRDHRSGRLLLAAGRGAVAAHAGQGHAVRRGVAGDQPAADPRVDRQPAAQRAAAQRRHRAASTTSRARPASTSSRTAARSRCSTSIATAIRISRSWRRGRRRSCASSATTSRRAAVRSALRLTGIGQEQPRRDRRPGRRRDRPADEDEDRAGGLGLPVAALEDADLRPRRRASASGALTVTWPSGAEQTFTDVAARHAACASSKAARSRREPLAPRPAPAAGTAPAAAGAGRGRRRRHLALRAVPGAAVLGARPRRRRRDRSPRSPASRRCCCSGRRRMPPARAARRRAGARPRRARRAPASRALAIALDHAGRGRARRAPAVARRAACRCIAAPAGSRDGLRARQPPPVHEPAGPAAADGVPDRRRAAGS